MHQYQRADSAWRHELTTELDDDGTGIPESARELLPPFLRYDCRRGEVEAIDPPRNPSVIREPEEFGDDWDEPLEADDIARLRRYFGAVEHLPDHFESIAVRVDGEEHRVVEGRRGAPMLTFDAPRSSLMQAVRYDIFDDLLIGNFVRLTVHGADDPHALYPHFTPYVAKYGDN